jgi:uncharacterized phage protein (TIGR01671 family)
MREIKFRAKRLDNKEWVVGFYGIKLNPITGEDQHYIMVPQYNPNTDSSYFVDIEVNPATVGQYTGHKDKNGREIYEGDICACKKREISADAFEIFWMREEGCWGWRESEESLDPFYQRIADYTEIIGNIHDNPELLTNT